MSHNRPVFFTVATLALAAVLVACSKPVETGTPPATEPPLGSSLEDTEWVLTSLNGGSLIEGTNVTLGFTGGGLSGFAGCNAYGGGHDSGKFIATNDGSLTIPAIAITAQACLAPEGVMEQEQSYVEALNSAATYRMVDDRLEIDDATGETTLVFARQEEFPMDPGDLVGTAWLLSAGGSDITLVFLDESKIGGVAGCRGYYGTYEASGDDIRFPLLGMMGPVEHCSEALILQEGEYTTSLEWATNYRLSEGRLEISTARGEVLTFEPLPEDENADLEGTLWGLTAFIEERTVEEIPSPVLLPTDPLAGIHVTARFEASTLSGSAGCNAYSGAYTLAGPALTVGAIAATEMACLDPAGAMEQEQRYLGWLGDGSTYAIYGSQLWIETNDGRGLVFTAQEQTVPPTSTPTRAETPEVTPSSQAVPPANTPTSNALTYLGVVQQGGELGLVWNLADVRYGLQPDRLRVVVEMAELREHVPWFQVVEVDNAASPFPTGHDPSWGTARIDLIVSDLYARNSPITERLPLVPPDNPKVIRIGGYPTFDDARLGFSIGLTAVSAYEVHELTDPVRIVIDVLF